MGIGNGPVQGQRLSERPMNGGQCIGPDVHQAETGCGPNATASPQMPDAFPWRTQKPRAGAWESGAGWTSWVIAMPPARESMVNPPFGPRAARATARARARAGAAACALVALIATAPVAPAIAQVGHQAGSVAGVASPALRSRLQPRLVAEGEGQMFRTRSQQLAIQPMSIDVSRFAFTAPGQVANSRVQPVERGFSFTPSGQAGRRSGVQLGMTARSVVPTQAERSAAAAPPASTALTPAGHDVNVSVGYRGFTLSGGVSRMDMGVGGRHREGIDVGLGYQQRSWRAGVVASAQREEIDLLATADGPVERYAVEARGALMLSPGLSLGGSLRYRPAPLHPTPLDPNRDDRAVMLGGSVAF